MRIQVELCLIPLGVGTSLAPWIAQCQRIIEEAGLEPQMHAYGTNLEGEWEQVMACIRRCHEELHAAGAPRIHSSLKIGSRVDKSQSLADKVAAVNRINQEQK